jgi:hypothetical protein
LEKDDEFINKKAVERRKQNRYGDPPRVPITVYLIGHGRVATDGTMTTIPRNVTMHWGGPLGNTTKGISIALLKGELHAAYGTTGPYMSVAEHYLCGDMNLYHNVKIGHFFKNAAIDDHSYVLFTRHHEHSFTLTSIFEFLNSMFVNYELKVYWTCCRAFIGVKNPMQSRYEKRTIVNELRNKPPETPAPTGGQECNFSNSILVSKLDWQSLQDTSPGFWTRRESNYTRDKLYSELYGSVKPK